LQVNGDNLTVTEESVEPRRGEHRQPIPPVRHGELLLRGALRRPFHEVVQVAETDPSLMHLNAKPHLELSGPDCTHIQRSSKEPQADVPGRTSAEGRELTRHHMAGHVCRLPEVIPQVI